MGKKEDEVKLFIPSHTVLKLSRRWHCLDGFLIAFALTVCASMTVLCFSGHFSACLSSLGGSSTKQPELSHSDNTGFFNQSLTADPQCDLSFDSDRFDCWPEEQAASQANCEARGCCWNTAVDNLRGVPSCYYPRNFGNVYVVSSSQKTSTGLVAILQRETRSPYPNDVMHLRLEVTFESDFRLRIKISDPNSARYEVPINLQKGPVNATNPDYEVSLTQQPFAITVKRKSTGQILFDSANVSPLIFADQYLQIGTQLASTNVYGLGEHRGSFLLSTDWTKIVFWARDQAPTLNENLYGSHPFYLNLDSGNRAHGVFLLNSNAMEVDARPYSSSAALTYRTIGGILDFYIFLGPSPDDVVKQYVSLIGKPFFPPFWSLGFHLCKYGYKNADTLKTVIQRNRAAQIPYDTQWNDIDYMQSYLDWTYDKQAYAGLPDIVADLHSNNQHYIIIVDPGISVTQSPGSYPSYDEGLRDNVFIKADNGSNIIGKVWPGNTVFPDFFHPASTDWWYRQANAYHQQVPFDSLWTDMNEPSNFVDGSTSGCTQNSLDQPPYTPAGIDGGTLHAKTVCPSAKQHISTHYNLHSMYGFSEMQASMSALQKIRNKRSIVISRSTFPSSGRHGGHWLGDNRSGWSDLYYSIPGILNFQMFGVPLVGADICGFGGETTPELCVRWMQLGAFYPFMRNHDSLGSKDQDPGAFDTASQGYMRLVLQTRYCLLPFLYTLFYRSHLEGAPVARPLFFQYPEATSVDRQFMWGNSLLISPALEMGVRKISAYIPNDVWYDFYSGEQLPVVGQSVSLDAPLYTINLHIRGGSIIPIKPAAVTTTLMRSSEFNLTVALDNSGKAHGELFWDDGESLDTVEKTQYSLVEFSVESNILRNTVRMANYKAGKETSLAGVLVYGVAVSPGQVTVNGSPVPYSYHPDAKMLGINGFSADLLQPLTITW